MVEELEYITREKPNKGHSFKAINAASAFIAEILAINICIRIIQKNINNALILSKSVLNKFYSYKPGNQIDKTG